ncbi:MAG: prolipoprotein diacylglyceryl transferase [Acidimicrobiales bacterium]|nr:prolipoprotein diacylglyceryl transferase [Acidimicrobiales bacterium]
MIAAIPSPSFNTIGPFSIYGLCIALGVIAAVSLSQRRWTEVGGGEDDISAIAIWAVPAGVVGARIYHVITDWHRFEDESFWQIFNVRAGGLGIPGGMFLGVVAGMIVARARGISFPSVLDAIVPALPLAQAIGRWGNWFNQEVYGRPTDLPWGLEIDAAHRTGIPTEYQNMAENPTFHPTFLYESLWNLGLVGVIIWIDGKKIVPRGRLISVYMFGYGIARLWLETVRIDAATELAGVRVNIWMSIALIVGAGIVWFWPKKGDTSDDAVESDVLVE